MPAALDHLALPARDCEASARFLAELLGLAVERDGPERELFSVRLATGTQVIFQPAERFEGHHLAFRIDARELQQVVARLRARGIAFGNDPEDPSNMRSDDPLGGLGRVYFGDANGHLFEVCTGAPGRAPARRYSVLGLAACALIYFVLFAGMIFVVPIFERMFRDFGGTLPWPTRVVIAWSNFLRAYFISGSFLSIAPVFAPAFAGLWLQRAGSYREGRVLIVFGVLCGLIAGGLMLVSLYLPIFALADNIR